MTRLPPFPVDDATLDMVWAAIHPWEQNENWERSSLWDLLTLMSQLGGSDTDAVEEQLDDNTQVMRDPHYHDHDVISALITEVRRLRTPADE